MTTYVKPNTGALDQLEEVLIEYHHQLKSAGVTVAMLFVFAERDKHGEIKAPALKLHGIPAAATTKALSLKLRAHGLPDSEIVIDGDKWEVLPHDQRVALLDHELTHLELVYKDNEVQLDDFNRPKIKMRLHDHNFGWFDEIVERHGKDSMEKRQAQTFMHDCGQLYLDI